MLDERRIRLAYGDGRRLAITQILLQPRAPSFPEIRDWHDIRTLLSNFREQEVLVLARQYESPDARNVALTNIALIVGSAHAVISVIDNVQLWSADKLNDLFGFVDEHPQRIVEDLEKFQRISMLTLAQFQFEHLFKVLMIADGVKHPPRVFAELSRTTLDYFDYPSVNRAVRVMNVAAHLRNTLHNNGIHENADLRVQVNGYVYTLLRGRRCDQASWAHILHILRAELRVIERLLLLPKVRAMGFVSEPYSAAIEAGN